MTSDMYMIVDIETTGLRIATDQVLEVAVLPVGPDLNPLDEGCTVVVNPGVEVARLIMDDFVRDMHTKNGLLTDIEDGRTRADAMYELVHYFERFAHRNQVPMTGSSVHFDRKFLERDFPKFERCFHYRNIDISSLKELWLRWFPNEGEPPKKKESHRALDDCYESLDELRWYHERLKGWYLTAGSTWDSRFVERACQHEGAYS